MAIETEIKGSPDSIQGAATWVQDTLAKSVDSGAQSMADARRAANGEWRGETGTAFCDAMARGVEGADSVHDMVKGLGTTLADYASSLRGCQNRMAAIRGDARSAGLTVNGYVIESPGSGPAHPGPPPGAASQGQVDGYGDSVAAYNAHQEKVTAYNRLLERAEEVWDDIERAWDRVSAKNRAMDGVSWTFTLTDIAGGLAGATLELHSSILAKDARYFRDLADEGLRRLANTSRVPPGGAQQFYDDLDHYRGLGASADDTAAAASKWAKLSKAGPLGLGGLLTVGGIYYDYLHGGESIEQAVTSNVGGFAASVATGAVVGTAIGGPVGTVVGTVVGAGVGVFTSGMIDGLWESGGDVGEAFMAGLDTVADTGEALLDLGEDVGGAIVDGIGGLFD